MKNKQIALEALENDCEVQEHYFIPGKGTCALGCLARLAGVPDDVLEEADSAFIWNERAEAIKNAIYDKFGLGLDEQNHIQDLNDNINDEHERRHAVCDFVRNLPGD